MQFLPLVPPWAPSPPPWPYVSQTTPSSTPDLNGLTWNGEPFLWTQVDAWVGILTALGTLAAVVAAVVVAFREHAARVASDKRASAIEDEARARAERAQASRVFVGSVAVGAYGIRNDSDQAIYAVSVYAFTRGAGLGVKTAEHLFRPGMAATIVIPDWDDATTRTSTYAATFRDDSDRWWARFDNGDLISLPDDTDAARDLVTTRLVDSYESRHAPRTNFRPTTGSEPEGDPTGRTSE